MPSPETDMNQALAEVRRNREANAIAAQAGRLALLNEFSTDAGVVDPAISREISIALNSKNIPVDFSQDPGTETIAVRTV